MPDGPVIDEEGLAVQSTGEPVKKLGVQSNFPMRKSQMWEHFSARRPSSAWSWDLTFVEVSF